MVPTDLDEKSGFIHLSTAAQVPGTLGRFFRLPPGEQSSVYLLRVELAALVAQGAEKCVVKWENGDGEEGAEWEEGFFPHVYFGDGRMVLEKEEVESVVEFVSRREEEGWEGALGRTVEGWLV
ncbi:uncharacterized protein AB675_7323 [Cyphellophora attinorum]|uniref:DUF952 domain-containing protein n=1 Tax=Cyphellophora attinorum TaxID=1664694 RepID=A0A0N1GZC3_9EURO|nr:uncharacterized protein AB675_7323 [Phialophora attinorum]KPI36355.1 hypothetical protein AB675_7323 [Phialophora attinorum]